LKRKGHTEYEPVGYVNIPPWKEGDERRGTGGCGQLYVRVVERMDKERVTYTVEIDPRCLVEGADEKRMDCALGLYLRRRAPTSPDFGNSIHNLARGSQVVGGGPAGLALKTQAACARGGESNVGAIYKWEPSAAVPA